MKYLAVLAVLPLLSLANAFPLQKPMLMQPINGEFRNDNLAYAIVNFASDTGKTDDQEVVIGTVKISNDMLVQTVELKRVHSGALKSDARRTVQENDPGIVCKVFLNYSSEGIVLRVGQPITKEGGFRITGLGCDLEENYP